ncbi:copper resistance CopC family protein [Kocuria atrinae]|uniref:CopC domain-containing protein n=1 Tax=Kocuria atrinae TaxID=592377 RepID=A0ABN2XLS5_9MICC|nr:copper resistance protein CopC [Kocuria sp.]
MHIFDATAPAPSARTTPPTAVARAATDRRPLAAVLLALLTALFMFVSTAQPAAAHDELISTDPEPGASLDASPESLTLTFSGNVMEIGREIRVTDSNGESLIERESTVERQRVIQPLSNPGSTEDETYTVVWRVVSEDGHPIEGTYEYTVGAGAGDQAGQSPTPEESAASTGEQRDDTASEEAEPAGESGTPGWLIPVVGGVGALALLIVVLVLATRNKRH